MSSDFDSDVPRTPASVYVTLALIMGGLTLAAILFVVVAARSEKEAGAQPASPAKSAAAKDPYTPDCAIVRDYLKRQYGAFQVVSWGKRTIFEDNVTGGHVMLSVRFRAGGGTKTGLFTIGPGDVVESASITD